MKTHQETINKTSHLLNFGIPSNVNQEINTFIDLCAEYATSLNKSPQQQHLYSKFLLEAFAVSGEVKNIRYDLYPSGKIRPKELPNISPTAFSRRTNFYTVDTSNTVYEKSLKYGSYDSFRVEKLFAGIESASAEMLKFRQTKEAYDEMYQTNPYLYPPHESDMGHVNRAKEFLVSEEKRRVVIAVFLAMQYCKSENMYRIFNTITSHKKFYRNLGLKEFQGVSFGDYILFILPSIAKNFYGRSWIWGYSENHLMVPERTPMAQLFTVDKENRHLIDSYIEKARNVKPGAEKVLVLPIGPQSFIMMLQNTSFKFVRDKVVYSDSITLQNLIISSLFLNFSIDLNEFESKKEINSLSVAMHPSADMRNRMLTKPEEIGTMETIKVEDLMPDSEADFAEFINVILPIRKNARNDIERNLTQKFLSSFGREILVR